MLYVLKVINMKKNLLYCSLVVVLFLSFTPNIVNAAAVPEGAVGEAIREMLGCPGGNKKCFSGTVSYNGLSFTGTWYMD